MNVLTRAASSFRPCGMSTVAAILSVVGAAVVGGGAYAAYKQFFPCSACNKDGSVSAEAAIAEHAASADGECCPLHRAQAQAEKAAKAEGQCADAKCADSKCADAKCAEGKCCHGDKDKSQVAKTTAGDTKGTCDHDHDHAGCSHDKPAEKPSEKPAAKPAEQTAEKPAAKPAN